MDVGLPFADFVAYLSAVGASLAQILPQINLYPSSPPLRRSPIIFPLFPHYSPCLAKCSFDRDFPPEEGEQVIWGDHQPIGQASSAPRGLGFCQLVALHMMHLTIVLYSPKVFLHTARAGACQITFILKPVILLPVRMHLFYAQTFIMDIKHAWSNQL